MTGYTVAVYATLAAAKTALEALSNNNEVHFTAYTEGARQVYAIIYRPKVVLESMALTDVSGVNTVVTADTTEGKLSTGVYKAVLEEAGTVIFYPDYNGTKTFILSRIGLMATDGAALNIIFVYKPLSAWKDAGAINENYVDDVNLNISAGKSSDWTYLGPFNLPFAHMPMGIAVITDKACTVYMQVLKEA